MGTILFLIGFPIIIAVILLVSKEDKVRDVVVKFAALVIAAASIVVAVQYFKSGGDYIRAPLRGYQLRHDGYRSAACAVYHHNRYQA